MSPKCLLPVGICHLPMGHDGPHDATAQRHEDGGRIRRGGWHYPYCWRGWVHVGMPLEGECECEARPPRWARGRGQAILAIEAEAADHPPYPTPDEFAGMTHEQFVAFLDRIGARRFTEAKSTRERLDVPPEAIEWARELVRQGYRDEHIVTFTEDGYGLEHPIRCRPNLTGCILNEWLRTQMEPDREPGRYVMEWHNNGPRYRALAREETGE